MEWHAAREPGDRPDSMTWRLAVGEAEPRDGACSVPRVVPLPFSLSSAHALIMPRGDVRPGLER